MEKRLMVGVGGLLAIVAVIIVCMTESEAHVPVTDGYVILLTSSDGDQDSIVIYHKPSSSFLVYGHTSRGLSLMKIRKLKADFELAELMDDVPYSRKGYSVEYVKKEGD